MLVLSRKSNQEILIGDNIKITVLKLKGNTVRLGIEAPKHVRVIRGELPRFEEEDSALANVTVVYSNKAEDNASPTVDVLPFTKKTNPKLDSKKAVVTEPKVESISFEQRLPENLKRSRLTEIVNELTTR